MLHYLDYCTSDEESDTEKLVHNTDNCLDEDPALAELHKENILLEEDLEDSNDESEDDASTEEVTSGNEPL